MARYPGFIGPSGTPRSKIVCDDRTVNLYIEKNESGTGKAPYSAYRVPGYRTWCDLGTNSPVRGSYTLNGAAFAVAGGTLYELPSTLGGSATTRATGISNPGDGNVSIIGSGDISRQLAIAAEGSLYSFDLQTDTLTLIPDISATQLVFLNSTAIALDPNTSTLYASDVADFSTWDALAVAQRNSAADKIVAIARVNTELWVFGSQTTSVYYDSGAADFPLTPNPNIFIQRGILAPWSVAIADGLPIWLGTGIDGAGTVYRAQGYTPQAISTNAVEYQLSTYSTLLDAEAFVYQAEGHLFYVLNFPTADHTWVYDVSEGLWHERGDWNGDDYGQVPIRSHVFCFDTHLVGSLTDGLILEQTLDVATETDGATSLRWNRRAPHLCDELHEIGYDRLQLDAEVGTGMPFITGDPETAPSVDYAAGSGITNGEHYWACTFVTAEGESASSPVSATLDMGSLVGNPGLAPTVAYLTDDSGATYPFAASDAARQWAYTFTTAAGETLPSPVYDAGVVPASPPASTYFGDVEPLPIGGAGVTGRKIYRTVAGGSQLKLVAAIDNTVTYYHDLTTDGNLGATAPSSNTASRGNRASLTSIPLGPPRAIATSARRIYRTAAAGSQLKLVATISDNTTTTYTDSTADGSLGVDIPTTNTSGIADDNGAGGQVYLRWSNDGGQSFGNVHAGALGAIGQYRTRVIWRQLGAGRDRVFDLYGAAPVVTALIDAYLTTHAGAS